MPAVLDFIRSEDERLKEVPDEALAQFLADTEPDSLRDPEFAAFYYSSKPSTRTQVLAPGSPRQAQLPRSPFGGVLGTVEEQIAASPAAQPAPAPDTTEVRRIMSSRDALVAATSDPVARENIRQEFNAQLRAQGVTVLEDKPIGQAVTTPTVTLPTIAPLPSEASTALKVGAGAANAVFRLAEFFTSPLGIATLGLGALPKAAQQAVAGVFAVDMARHTPEIVRQFDAAHERGDTQAKTEYALSGALNTLFTVKAGKHALGIETKARVAQARNPAEAIGAELLGYMNDPRVKERIEQSAADEALAATLPQRAQVSLAPLTEAAAREAGVKELPTPEPIVEPQKEVPVAKPEISEPVVPPTETPTEFVAKLESYRPAEREIILRTIEANSNNPELPSWKREWLRVNQIRREASAGATELSVREQETVERNVLREPPSAQAEKGALETVPQTPVEATAKAQAEVTDTAQTEGKRSAKEIKEELVARLEKAIESAVSEKEWQMATPPEGQASRVTFEIPGDGTFTVWNTKENLTELLRRAKRISTATEPPKGFTERKPSRAEGKQFLEEAKVEAPLESRAEAEAQGAIALPGPGLAPAPAAIPSLPPKSQRQIITDLAKGLKLPIRFGRLRTTRFAGYFLRVQNLIGSKKANDIPIVTHEVGHKLDSVFNFASNPTLRSELDALGDPSMPGSRSSWTPSKTQKYKLQEGVAEFVRHWLVDPPNAAKLAPTMLKQFEAALNANKDFGDTMRQAQSDIQTWRNAAPQARLRSHISIGENPNKTPYTASQLTRDLVDDLHFLRLAADDAKAAGTDLPPSQNPYLLARNLRGSYGMADTFIRSGVADFKTKAVTLGTSLEDALKPVAGRIPDFRDWIVAKRAQELHAQGRQTGLVDSDVQATSARFANDPAFNDAFNRIKAWNDSVLQYAQDAGLVTADGTAAMREMNQDYVPFHRVFEVGAGEAPAVEGLGTGRGLNVGKPGSLKALKGSPRDIIDPLETMVRNAYSVITASEKQAINLAVADLARKPDMGKWVEHIATPKESVKVGIEKIRQQLEDAGADLSKVPDDLLLQFFQNSSFAPFGENVIKVVQDGKPQFYRLKRELFETFHALDLEDSGTLVRILSQPAQVLRAGVTVAPDFALANALRDAFTSAIVSRHGLFPFEAVFRGMQAMLRDPKLVAEWQAAGGKNSIEASYFDRAKLQKFLSERITKDMTPGQRAWIVTKSPLQALRWLSSLSEEATRIGEYQKAFNDLRKGGMPEGDARRLAAFESRDRQDFAKGGAKTKIVRRLTAFWNAGLQGNIRLFQAFKEKPIQTTLRGLAFITIPKLLEQSLNWDDEDYWDRPQWQRDLFFMIPAGKGADNHTRFILIPTPFEAGILFGTFPGRILQTIREKNAEAAKTFPITLAKQTVPNPTPQWALTFFEDFMIGKNGWDVYRQRQIVPKSLEQLPAEMQWTEQTSLTARKLGQALGFSPMKIDHIINSTTGGIGRQLTHQVVDRVISLASGEARTAKGAVPGGRFVSTPAVVASQSIDDFYTTLDRIKTAAAGQKKGKNDQLAAWLPIFTRTERDLAQLRKAMRAASTDQDKNVMAEAILRTSRTLMQQFKEAENPRGQVVK